MTSITFDELIQAGLETTSKQLIIKLFEKNKEQIFNQVCENGNVEIVKLLLSPEHGANVNSFHYNPLIAASKKGHVEIVKLLIEHGADVKVDNNNALRWASNNGHVEVIKVLIENGADVKADNNEAIRYASENGHLEIVKLLIEKEADVKAENNYAIIAASSSGHLEIVKLLIEHGADVKAEDNLAIRCASQNGHLEVVKLLIEHGADVKADNNEALKLASQNGHLEVIKLLIDHGATVTESCLTKATPQVKDYLLSLTAKNKRTYYGIVSEGKLDIKLPDLQEFIKDNLYYYVYECQNKNGCFMVPDIIGKHTILSNLNLGIDYSIGFVYDI